MKILKLTALLLMLVTLVSCTGKSDETSAIPTQPEVLTNVYLSEKVSLPEGYKMDSNVTPLYKDGIFTVLCRGKDDIYGRPRRLVSFDTDGNVTAEEELIYDIELRDTVSHGIIRDGYVVLMHGDVREDQDPPRTNYLTCINLEDKTQSTSENLIPLFASEDKWENYYKILGFERDGDGYYYIFSDMELIVLDPDFGHVITYPASGIIESYAVRPDGVLTVYSSFTKGSGLYMPNPDTKIPDRLVETGTDEIISYHWYDPDGNMYIKNRSGIYALTKDGSNLSMDFKNSGIDPDSILIFSIPEQNLFLGGAVEYAFGDTDLRIFKKHEDIVITEVEIIDLAVLGDFDEYVSSCITEYNLMNHDKRIVVTEFGDMENGEMHLMTGIQTGTYKPDLIMGVPESAAVRKIVEDELYIDLVPYLENDDVLNMDYLFGAVKRIFSDGEKMWGISPRISVNTVSASAAELGDRTHWTLDELLDYAESLPADEDLMWQAYNSNAAEYILGPAGYSMFVDFDTHTSSFDSELFVRYLKFAASLPDNYLHYNERHSPYPKEALAGGKITLGHISEICSSRDWLRLKGHFPQWGHTVIGFPSDSPASSYATAEWAFVITSFADDSDEVWEIVKKLFPLDGTSVYYKKPTGIPALKYVFDAMAEEESTIEYFISFDIRGGMGTYYPENKEQYGAGMVVCLDEAEADLLRDFLDNRCGTSVMDLLPGELDSIIREEVSAFLGGMGTAEDCAKKIQSRVNLWMSEHE